MRCCRSRCDTLLGEQINSLHRKSDHTLVVFACIKLDIASNSGRKILLISNRFPHYLCIYSVETLVSTRH